jgi:peptidoglycan hydrolase-like protein with peptidoglycan-binding domain
MGRGEEGLARALEWGARKVKGNVFGPDHEGPPAESFALEKFPAPKSALAHIPSNPIALLNIEDPKYGETSASIAAIQYSLKKLGYFDHEITSFFGDVTRDALKLFARDLGIAGTGEVADTQTRNMLVAHSIIAAELSSPLPEDDILFHGTSGKSVRILQRIFSLLGNYHGEIDGEYTQEILSAVYQFQVAHGIVSSISDTGAGMVGPQTRRALLTAWRDHRIAGRGGSEIVASL